MVLKSGELARPFLPPRLLNTNSGPAEIVYDEAEGCGAEM